MKFFLYCLLIFLTTTNGANILGIFPLPSRSHYIMFERLFKALAAKGHEVDIVGHFPLEKFVPRYNDLSLKGSIPILVNNMSVNEFKSPSLHTYFNFLLRNCGVNLCEHLLKTPTLINLKKTNKKYDLVFTEVFGSDCMLGFGYHFKAPVISFITNIDLPWGGSRIGNPDNAAYIPTYFSGYANKMSLKERLLNFLILVYSKLSYKFLSNIDSNVIAKEFFGPNLPDLEDLASNTSLLFLNSHFSINEGRPAVPNFIEVGGLHIEPNKTLNQYFEKILQTDTKGIIYFSMGSLLRSDTFSAEKLQNIFNAFSELHYKIVWKGDKDKFPKHLKIPNNIHFEKWCPQIDILCHPNVKLFISHGGLMGTQEAVYCGVPRLGIPFFGDQENNIRQSVKMGIALKLDYDDITKKTMLSALTQLLNDAKYKQNSEKLAKIFRDRSLLPIDTAIYWTEYVIRHKGAPQLRSPGADLTWYEYYLVDVAFVLLSIFFLILYFIFKLNLLIFKLFKKFTYKEKPKKE